MVPSIALEVAPMEAAEYRGLHEVEVVSPADWALRDIDEVLITVRRRHQ